MLEAMANYDTDDEAGDNHDAGDDGGADDDFCDDDYCDDDYVDDEIVQNDDAADDDQRQPQLVSNADDAVSGLQAVMVNYRSDSDDDNVVQVSDSVE